MDLMQMVLYFGYLLRNNFSMQMAFDYPGYIRAGAMAFEPIIPLIYNGRSGNIWIGNRVRILPLDWDNIPHSGLNNFDYKKEDYEVIAFATVPLEPNGKKSGKCGPVAILSPFQSVSNFRYHFLSAERGCQVAANSYGILTTKMLQSGTGWDPHFPVLVFPPDALEKL